MALSLKYQIFKLNNFITTRLTTENTIVVCLRNKIITKVDNDVSIFIKKG